MPVQLDDKYRNYPIYAQKIQTKANNPYFTDDDIAICIYIEHSQNFFDIIEDGDFIVLRGGAGTKNNFHIVKVIIKDNTVFFEATSDFLTDLPCKSILLEDIQEAPIHAKILFTASNRTNQEMLIPFKGTPLHFFEKSESEDEEIEQEFAIAFPSERNN